MDASLDSNNGKGGQQQTIKGAIQRGIDPNSSAGSDGAIQNSIEENTSSSSGLHLKVSGVASAGGSMDASLDGNNGRGVQRQTKKGASKRGIDPNSSAGSDRASKRVRLEENTSSSSGSHLKIGIIRFKPYGLPTLVYPNIDEKQKRAIRRLKLGNTLLVKFTTKPPDSLTTFLVNRVNTANCTLRLGPEDDPVDIDLFKAAAKVYGVMNKGKEFPIEKFGNSKRSSKCKRGVDIQVKSVDSFYEQLRDCRNKRKRTCKVYMYVILAWLLAPCSQSVIDLRFMEMVEKIDKIEEWNLTDLTVKLLVKGIKDLRNGSKNLIGSPVLLYITFLDMVDPAKVPNAPWIPADGFPRIQHIEDRHFKFIKAYEGHYDTVPIKKLEDSCYAEEKVYKMEDDCKLDEGTEDDVFDDESDDDMGHLVEVDVNSKEKGSEVEKFEGLKQQLQNLHCFRNKYKKACEFIAERKAAIPKELKVLLEGYNLSNEVLEKVTSHALSQNRAYSDNIVAFAEPLVKSLDAIKSIDQAVNDCMGTKKKNSSKGRRKVNASSDLVQLTNEGSEKWARYEYPAGDDYKDSIATLYCSDLHSLEEGFVSDRVLEMYTGHFNGIFPSLDLSSNILRQSHVCSPFFWSKLVTEEFEKVKSWLKSALRRRGIDLDHIKYLFLFVYESLRVHWSLIVIYRPSGGKSATTTMYLMDSLKQDNSDHVFDIAKSFVKNVLGVDGQEVKGEVVDVPQQEEADCAFFSCYNIRRVIKCVSAAHLEDIVKGINKDWYAPESAAALRQELVKLIEQYNLRYKPVATCQCGRHDSVLQKFGHTFRD